MVRKIITFREGIAGLLSKDKLSATNEIISNLGKFYELLQFIGTMNTPVIALMDGITSKIKLDA